MIHGEEVVTGMSYGYGSKPLSVPSHFLPLLAIMSMTFDQAHSETPLKLEWPNRNLTKSSSGQSQTTSRSPHPVEDLQTGSRLADLVIPFASD